MKEPFQLAFDCGYNQEVWFFRTDSYRKTSNPFVTTASPCGAPEQVLWKAVSKTRSGDTVQVLSNAMPAFDLHHCKRCVMYHFSIIPPHPALKAPGPS